jgi:hypothetical protein
MKKPNFLMLANDIAYSNVSDLTQLLQEIDKFGKAYSRNIPDSDF